MINAHDGVDQLTSRLTEKYGNNRFPIDDALIRDDLAFI